LVDTFSNCFSFISVNQKDTDTLKSHYNRLDNIEKTHLLIVVTTTYHKDKWSHKQ